MNKQKLLSITMTLLLGVSCFCTKAAGGLRESPDGNRLQNFALQRKYLSCHRTSLGDELLDAADRKDGRRLGLHVCF